MGKESKSLNRLVKHSFNFGLGNVIPRVIGFFLIPVYTIYLTPADFGIIDMVTALGSFLVIIMRLGMPGAVTRFYYDYKDHGELRNYVTTIFWFLLLLSLIIGLVVWIILKFNIELLLPGLPFVPYVWMIILWALLNSNTDLQRRLIQVREQSAYSAKLSVITSIVTILLTLYFVIVMKMGAFGAILATLVSGGIFFIQAQFYLHHDIKGKFAFKYLTGSVKYAAGIFPHQLMSNAAPLISRSILSGMESLAAVGLLGIGFRFVVPLNLLISAIQSAFTPIYFSIRSKEDETLVRMEISSLFTHIVLFGILMHTLVVCLGGLFIRLVTHSGFHDAALLVPGLVIYVFFDFLSAVTGNEILFQKKTGYVLFVSLIKNAIYIFLAYFLIDFWGTKGVIYSLILSTLIGFILSIRESNRLFKVFDVNFKVIGSFIFLIFASVIMSLYTPKSVSQDALLCSVLCFIALVIYLLVEYRFLKTLLLSRVRSD